MLKGSIQYADKHASEILMIVGIGGMWTAGAMVMRATPPALRAIDAAERKKGSALTNWETVQTCWKVYAPAVFTAMLSTVCLVGSARASLHRQAAMSAAYAIAENSLKEYQEKTLEVVGEKKEQEIRDKVACAERAQTPVNPVAIVQTGNGNSLCYDHLSGRYFWSSIDGIRKAVNEVNALMNTEGTANLNDFYDALQLSETEMGFNIGWSLANKGLMDVYFTSDLAREYNNTPCIVVNFKVPPVYNYENY